MATEPKNIADMTLAEMEAAELDEIRNRNALSLARREAELLESEAAPLPKPYLMVRVAHHPLQQYLPAIERMAAQGMQGNMIAARLGITVDELGDYAERCADVRLALTGGAARGVDETTAAARRGALIDGNAAMQRFLMESRGGFATPKEPKIAIAVNAPAMLEHAPVTIDSVHAMAARQQRLLAAVAKGQSETPADGAAGVAEDGGAGADQG